MHLSVMLSPPKPLEERQLYLAPCMLRLWGGVKRSNIMKFQLQSQFQRFLYQTLCVFSLKHIKLDFHSVAWIMPKGWDLGVWRVKKNFFRTWSCGILKGMMSRTGYKQSFHPTVERCPKLGHSPYLVASLRKRGNIR